MTGADDPLKGCHSETLTFIQLLSSIVKRMLKVLYEVHLLGNVSRV